MDIHGKTKGTALEKTTAQLASGEALTNRGVVGDGFTPSSLIFAGGAAVALLTFVVLFLIRREERK